ncbi:MAG: hypothetical protein KatS3mg113_0481 [Planctomycetaceae bacterium]|nr:MAG: hypothetical protein KatS3mg113_0481 [Planctomycetaceae bacterium]
MNMNHRPSLRQLHNLLFQADDLAGHHVMWVGRDGDVHLTLLKPGHPVDLWAEQMQERLLFHLVFQRGSGFVGPRAANDPQWLRDLMQLLCHHWHSKTVGCLVG